MAKDTLDYNGLKLTAGSPSSGGKARFFGESPEHKTKVELNGKIYTVYNTVSLYEEGSVVTKPEVEVTFDSKNRPVTKPKSKASTETPSAPPDLKAQLVALAAAMGLKLA